MSEGHEDASTLLNEARSRLKMSQDHVHKNSIVICKCCKSDNFNADFDGFRSVELRGDEAGASSDTGDASAALFGAEILGKDQGADGRTVDVQTDVQL